MTKVKCTIQGIAPLMNNRFPDEEHKENASNKKTYKDVIKGGVFVTPDEILHKNQKWTIDRRSAVNPSTRGRVMVNRPVFPNWTLDFDLNVIDDRAEIPVIKEILEYAGLYVGIGTFRPKFGRFEVKKFQKTK